MRYRLIGSLFLCLLSATIVAAKFSANISSLQIKESATRFLLHDKDASVLLALENSSAAAVKARIVLDLIDTRDSIHARAITDTMVASGSSTLTIPLLKTGSADYYTKELTWYRLRYSVNTINQSDGATGAIVESDPVSGVISLSEIMPYIFGLQVSATREAGQELKYVIRARTLHPLTGNPIGGVKTQAVMTYEDGDDERKLNASGVTNSKGEALLEFNLPKPLKTDEIEIKVSAESNGYYQEAREDVSLIYRNQILVSTDKPLYQPGQMLHRSPPRGYASTFPKRCSGSRNW